jgi:hypothetical protein
MVVTAISRVCISLFPRLEGRDEQENLSRAYEVLAQDKEHQAELLDLAAAKGDERAGELADARKVEARQFRRRSQNLGSQH